MPDYQSPKAKTLQMQALELLEAAERAKTPGEKADYEKRAQELQREADAAENAAR